MGDWGEDTPAQRKVADAMAAFVEKRNVPFTAVPFTAVLLAGDSFYFKLTGVDDPRWQKLFEHMYDPRVLTMPFYTCLGNHDYDGNNLQIELAYAKAHPGSRFKLPARWYRVDLPKEGPVVTVIMLDSNRQNLSDAQWEEQRKWLEDELAKPRARWTICCAHHPLFSNGLFWGNGILQHDWGTLFEKYHVDFYLCGHEHNLQHLEIPGWHESFVLCGGGGAHSHPMARDDRGFSRSIYGFVHFELTPDAATVEYLDQNDKPVHVFRRTKDGTVRVLMTTPNDKRTGNPLETYLGIKKAKPATAPAIQP